MILNNRFRFQNYLQKTKPNDFFNGYRIFPREELDDFVAQIFGHKCAWYFNSWNEIQIPSLKYIKINTETCSDEIRNFRNRFSAP